VAKKQYESTQVAVPRRKRIAKIAFALLFCVYGPVLLVGSLLHKTDDSGVVATIGAAILAIGLVALIRFKATHEPQLTEKGNALKAADDAARSRRTKELEDLFRSLAGIVLVIFAVVYFAPTVLDALASDVRMYPIQCASWDSTNNKCAANKWEARGVRLFAVHSSQQIVIASYPDDDLPPTRYYNCAVVDRLNWACTMAAETDSGRVTMSHGVFKDQSEDDPSTRYTSRWRWWTTKLSSDN
jgi:hypothetical protein